MSALLLAAMAALTVSSAVAAPGQVVMQPAITLDSMNLPKRPEPNQADTVYHSRFDSQFYSTLEMLRPFAPEEAPICPFELPVFNCSPQPATPRNNGGVRNLRPQDVAAVMALGDSVTAGFAMKNSRLPSLPIEYRGSVYSAGADDGVPTLFNFFKRFNPNIMGGVKGTTSIGSSGSELNRAVTGAVVQDLPGQITSLKKQLESSKYKAIKDLPKLLVIFIGPNNLCGACTSDKTNTPDAFEAGLRKAMLQIKQDVPNTFVALIATFNISQVWDASRTSSYCKTAFSTLGICGCAGSNAANRILMDTAGLEYNRRAQKVADEIEALEDDKFQVTVLPGLVDQAIADFGQDLLSNLDCFHPNECANQAFAFSIWNNLFAPRGRKPSKYDPYNFVLECPTANDFMQ